ncbi:class I SAM-dependent methyltransferase [Simiduia sp. 21SJ11W-1]|uniref:class I SAM-dependent methyltransferase n=1 Tax=Simiduia sp. 21SJ11W-1 TaxID=2909669 RepID=UPI00209CF9BA|nr:class I SAM-dependent methyltransferase [Simiduia sp. 21SJ11W-1]UTA49270.1 class I SAM-dependent methyltransferase [Simiduia sp. 21SJ11W-1]
MLFHEDKRREYFQCPRCELVFVPERWHVDSTREKAEYDLHDNSLHDTGYLKFLRRLGEPLVARLGKHGCGAKGLDVGCGPGPALQHWLNGQGFEVQVFDKFYAPDARALLAYYDFITATEVVEHLRAPGLFLHSLWQLLRAGGYLGLMTKRVKNREAFVNWHYKNDITHIAFFSEQSFHWLAREWGAELEFVDSDVVIFRKQ